MIKLKIIYEDSNTNYWKEICKLKKIRKNMNKERKIEK